MPRPRRKTDYPFRTARRVRELDAKGVPPEFVARIVGLAARDVRRILGRRGPGHPRRALPREIRFDSVDPGDGGGRVGLPPATWARGG